MKNKIFTILMAFIILLNFAGCQKQKAVDELPPTSTENNQINNEKDTLTITGVKVHVDEQIWMDRSEIILKGRVIEIGEPYFTNPTGELITSDGITPVTNAYVTEYVVEIDEIYKGEWEKDTITVQVNNRLWMTVEQALYGEDDKAKVINEIPDVVMKEGECIIGVCLFSEDTFGNKPFYELTYGDAGYFVPQRDGTYRNTATGSNNFSIDPAKLFEKQ